MSEQQWVCVFNTKTSYDADEVAAELQRLQIPFQRRTVLDPQSSIPDQRIFVSQDHQELAGSVVEQWMDLHPVFDKESLNQAERAPNLLALIMVPGIFIVCFLFLRQVAGASIWISLLLSLPLPLAIYFVIQFGIKYQKSSV